MTDTLVINVPEGADAAGAWAESLDPSEDEGFVWVSVPSGTLPGGFVSSKISPGGAGVSLDGEGTD